MFDPIYRDYLNREAIRALHEARLVPFTGADVEELLDEEAVEEFYRDEGDR